MSLPADLAATALQGQINQALGNPTEVKAPPAVKKGFVQVDGQTAGGDSSEDEDEVRLCHFGMS